MKLKYCMVVLSPLLINHTHKFNVLPTDLKTEAVHCQGQGQQSSRPRPRPQNFVLELSSRSRPVLEDPIPAELWTVTADTADHQVQLLNSQACMPVQALKNHLRLIRGSTILDHIKTRFLKGRLIRESDLYTSVYGIRIVKHVSVIWPIRATSLPFQVPSAVRYTAMLM